MTRRSGTPCAGAAAPPDAGNVAFYLELAQGLARCELRTAFHCRFAANLARTEADGYRCRPEQSSFHVHTLRCASATPAPEVARKFGKEEIHISMILLVKLF